MSRALQEGALARRHKALTRLAHAHAVLAPLRDGPGFGVFSRGDRRRRPMAQLRRDEVQALAAEGAIGPSGISECYLLSGSGRAQAREQALGFAPLAASGGPVEASPIARLLRLAADGACRFSGREILAARRIWQEIELGPHGQAKQALGDLPAPMAAAVTAFCRAETGVEALERQQGWPARSGRLVLKLALAMLADHYRLA